MCSPLDADSSSLYLKPKTKWCFGIESWYENRPVGRNTLASTYKRICSLAGLEGHYSNHSGRATAATTLLKAGIPDKMALKRTGHRSLESLREYQTLDIDDTKRVSEALSSCSSTDTFVINETSVESKVAHESNLDWVEQFNEESDLCDVVLSQALDVYESNSRSEPFYNNTLNGLFCNANIVTVNVYISK